MKKLTVLLMLSAFSGSCQDFGKLEVITDLPGHMKEISGVEKFEDEDKLWMINDSRNPPEVYDFDLQQEKSTQTIRVKNAVNIDWEDLATHPNGTLYIGDFGNNISNREDLTIYHIKNPGDLEKRRTEADITQFTFEDQINYPPKRKDISFDVESLIYLKQHFYVFTRNRAKKFDGTTRVYKIPAKTGLYTATYVGSIETCDDAEDCQVTSAAIHHPTGKIALLSYNKVWIISDYTEDHFNSGTIEKIKLKHNSQKEGICFKSENEIYITDEKTKGKGRNLYLLKL